MQGFSGALSDKLQRRKPIALFGYLLSAIAKPLMGLATGLAGAVWRALAGPAGRGHPLRAARCADRRVGGRGEPRPAFGLEGFGDNAGAFLGPLLAVFLLYALHVGIRTIFYLAVIPGLLAFFMVLLVKERPGGRCREGEDRHQPAANFPASIGDICWRRRCSGSAIPAMRS